MLIAALAGLGLPIPVAALAPSWLASGVLAALGARYFESRPIGWALATLPPSLVVSSSLISSEALCLVWSLGGLVAHRRGAAALAGLAFGVAALFRPVAVFALLGALAVDALHRRYGRGLRLGLAAAASLAGGLLVAGKSTGDPLLSFRRYDDAYEGDLITWPFSSLIRTALSPEVAGWKVAYVGIHVALALAACAMALRNLRTRDAEPRDLVAAVWLLGNTGFVLCIGNVWGFHDFPRFLTPAAPALFWFVRRWLPERLYVWAMIGVLSAALASWPIYRRLVDPQGRSTTLPAPSATSGDIHLTVATGAVA
jgi:hypothetical protein